MLATIYIIQHMVAIRNTKRKVLERRAKNIKYCG